MPNSRRQDRELDALYATLPKLVCQGYCSASCGPIATSARERARIETTAHRALTAEDPGPTCSMLTADRRCSVYEIRPMICRLWGLVQRMPCPYGCRPEGGLLPDSEGKRLLMEAERIGGRDEEGLARLVKDLLPLLSGEDAVRNRRDQG
jgi:hypothetical protein